MVDSAIKNDIERDTILLPQCYFIVYLCWIGVLFDGIGYSCGQSHPSSQTHFYSYNIILFYRINKLCCDTYAYTKSKLRNRTVSLEVFQGRVFECKYAVTKGCSVKTFT